MAFTEKTKLEAKRRAAFRCCICQRLFVEIHHIIPQSEGGADTLENAAPLCASCHDLFGGNPEKRKQIREMRNYWWELVRDRNKQIIAAEDLNSISVIQENPENINALKEKRIAIYHNVFANEGFDETANILFRLVKGAQEQSPNQKRVLFLDIEEHSNKQGGFDNDMFEIQRHFILGFLMPFLTEAYLPLISVKNNKRQRNDIPDGLKILPEHISNELNQLFDKSDSVELYLANKYK